MKKNNFERITSSEMIENLPGIIFWKSLDLRYCGGNKNFLNFVGLNSFDDLLGKKDDELPCSEHYKNYLKMNDFNIISEQKPVFSIQKNIILKNGSLATVVTDKYPIFSKNKQLVGLVGISSALYDQETNSQTYLNNIIEILPYFIFWKNKNSIYLGCNQKFAKLVGKKNPREVIGKDDFDLNWGEGEAEIFRMGDQETIAGKSLLNAEEILLQPDGSEIVMLVNKVPLLSKTGECIGVLGTSTDITELKQTQEKLKESILESALANSRTQAETELRQAVTILTGSIAHDMRTPLASINMAASAIENTLPYLIEGYHLAHAAGLPLSKTLPETHINKVGELSKIIINTAREMNEFINTTLNTIKKTVSGQLEKEELTTCELQWCLQNVLQRYPFVDNEQKLVHWDRRYHFPFLGNAVLFFRMISNLLKNSLYQIKKNQKGEIFIWAEKTENANLLHFKDTAGGAEPEIIEKIFSGYQTTKKEGTGIGLSFCKLTMQSFGGDIICHSVLGDYIQFTLSFPGALENSCR